MQLMQQMKIMKEIDGVLLMYGYVADDSSKVVLVNMLTYFPVVPCYNALQYSKRVPTIQAVIVLATSRDIELQMWHRPYMWKLHAFVTWLT